MKAESPRSRIEALKREISSMDKRVSTVKPRPLYESLPLQVKVENPSDTRKAELQSQLSALHQRTDGKVVALRAKIQSLESEESAIHQEIEYEKTAIETQKQETEAKLQHHQGLLRVLQMQYEELQQAQSQTQGKLEAQYQSTSADYDSKLHPLETRLESVWKSVSEAESMYAQYRNEVESVEERMGMSVEDMDMVTLHRAEFVAHREEMEELYDDLKRKYGKDISDFVSGAESKHAVSKLKDRKNVLIDRVKAVDSSLEANSTALKSVQDRFQAVQNHLHSLVSAAPNMRTQQDLEKLETLIKLKTPDFTQLLEAAVLEINAVNGFDVDEWILRHQMEEVDSRLQKMETDTQREQTRLQQEAIDLAEELDRCDNTARDGLDRGSEDYIRDLKRRLYSVKDAQQQLARQYQRRRAAVEQWRSEADQLLSQVPASTEVKASDELIIDDFKSRVHFPGGLDPLLSQYLVKLRERERYLQANQGTVAQLQAQLADIERQGESLKLEKAQLLREKSKLRQELTKLIMEEKRLTKKGDDHASDPIRSTQSLKVGKRIEDILGKVDYWEERIETCNRTITELSAEYRKSEQRKEELSHLIPQTVAKVSELKAAEADLLHAIASLLEQKKAALVDIIEKMTSGMASPAQSAREKALLAQIAQTTPTVDSLRGKLKTLTYDNSPALKSLSQRLADTQTALVRTKSELLEVESELERARLIELQIAEIDEPKAAYRSSRRHLQPSELPDTSLRSSRSTSQQRTATKRSCLSNSPTRQGFVDSHSSIYSHLASEADQSTDNIDFALARGIQLASELPNVDSSVSLKGKMKKYFRLDDASTQEQVFFDKVIPTQVQQILEGTDLFKKFTQRQSSKQRPFDPLNTKEAPPEACGYGIRNFRLNANLTLIEVRHPLKPGVETYSVDQLVAPMLPQITMTVLKYQKKLLNSDTFLDDYTSLTTGREMHDKEYSEMRESGFINVNSELFQEKCRTCSMYPFSIALQQGVRLELIAKSYATFKAWVTGLNALVKYKKQLPRLRQKIETYTTMVS